MSESEERKPDAYARAGVNYELMDPFKVAAQQTAAETAILLRRHGFEEIGASRGESAYLIERGDLILALVEEGLGTKNLVADAYVAALKEAAPHSFYAGIAQDTVAMIVNDLITVGAMPMVAAMHLAVGDSDWFLNQRRALDLITGWKRACLLSNCTWGPGETPTLKGVVAPGAVVLSGSAMGIIQPRSHQIVPRMQHGDAIILLHSSGIHANGLTLARKIADKLPEGYLTKIAADGPSYGEALLEPTHIYVRFMQACFDRGVDVHYAVNITGHGWRKLMRATEPFAYVIERLPPKNYLFDFIQTHGQMSDFDAYGNLNMGAGFAIMVAPEQIPLVEEVMHYMANDFAFGATVTGHVEKSADKKVIIKPKGLEYSAQSLAVR